jgi:arsenate reductase
MKKITILFQLIIMNILTTNSGSAQVGVTDAYWAKMDSNLVNIPADRKDELTALSKYIVKSLKDSQHCDLMFICTHNSRRSHLGQIWAAAVANHLGIGGVRTYSAGTEATAFNPLAIAALERTGCLLEHIPDPILLQRLDPSDAKLRSIDAINLNNKVMMVTYAPKAKPIFCFSKVIAHPYNSTSGFGAIMTCSSADAACPTVTGANFRVAIPYIDPKISDGTPEEAATYDARCLQIATEMLWVMKEAKKSSSK